MLLSDLMLIHLTSYFAAVVFSFCFLSLTCCCPVLMQTHYNQFIWSSWAGVCFFPSSAYESSACCQMFIQTVPSLVLMCRAFPPLCEDVTALLVQIARVCRSQLAINSNTAVTGKQRVHVPRGSCMTYCVCMCMCMCESKKEQEPGVCLIRGSCMTCVYAWERSGGGGGDQGFLHDLVCVHVYERERESKSWVWVWSGVPAWPCMWERELGAFEQGLCVYG